MSKAPRKGIREPSNVLGPGARGGGHRELCVGGGEGLNETASGDSHKTLKETASQLKMGLPESWV